MTTGIILGLGSAVSLVTLLLLDVAAFQELLARVLPILGFVAAMSVVVNAAESEGTFGGLLSLVQRLLGISTRGRRSDHLKSWLLIIFACLLTTIFFSLDTTAILLTPLVIKLARHAGLSLLGATFAVVWTANLGSLLLPISNLTNLLALQTEHFSGLGDYLGQSWFPSLVLIVVAALCPLLIRDRAETPEQGTAPPGNELNPRAKIFAVLIGILLILLLTPLEFWLPTTVVAVISVLLLHRWNRPALSWHMVPWNTLAFALLLTTLAAIVHHAGWLDAVISWLAGHGDGSDGLFTIALAGGVLANLINNIPAYLALEPAADSARSLLTLLIGVNAAPIITPWASLATLLWADQARRQGVEVRWRTFILLGLVIAPVAVGLGVLAVLVSPA
ncbi:SLC13 family permease [Corynebacterium halotolerans]|uniref:Citrate transporter-like domain-containing protein n=1 Tax=Corynebacterium halotolerans YIM 70093 = DSM 44683 TaxID=1121362 RepID=M1P4Z2_9CORY|nr:SLC13 family permease [Corynebacterium halotolerans]AGF71736.1 hypothetical protein A605_03625 [Corynebacterium halotolerans YIM 70093 = DSM 44683]